MLNVNALAASTHILVPVQLEMKSIAGSAELVEWCITTSEELQLEPRPPILGFIPSMYDDRRAIHKAYWRQLPEIAKELQIKVYPKVRDSVSLRMLPLKAYPCKNIVRLTQLVEILRKLQTT